MSFPIVFSEYALESFADIKTQINNKWGHAVLWNLNNVPPRFWL
jgi:hypothetical protein